MLREIYHHEQLAKAARQGRISSGQAGAGPLARPRLARRLARLAGHTLIAIGVRLVANDQGRTHGRLGETHVYVAPTAFSQN